LERKRQGEMRTGQEGERRGEDRESRGEDRKERAGGAGQPGEDKQNWTARRGKAQLTLQKIQFWNLQN
jgi:hypothetical protein